MSTLAHKKKFIKKFVETLLLTTGNSELYIYQAKFQEAHLSTSGIIAVYQEVLVSDELRAFDPKVYNPVYRTYETIKQDLAGAPRHHS